jgi:carbonic anhydrase
MLSTLAFGLPLLALTAFAAPTSRTASVQVQFANDVTGANGNAFIPLDGSLVSLGQAYSNTNLEINGTLNVTSLAFTANFQNVACTVFKNGATVVASIADPKKDFETFSQKPLNWQTGFDISCAVVSTPARRTASTVQVQFANDVTGANGNAWIPLDGSSIALGEAYANTNLEVDGTLFVTSLEFTSDFQNVACTVLKNGATVVASIADPKKDFETFSQKPLNWQTGFTISCTLS